MKLRFCISNDPKKVLFKKMPVVVCTCLLVYNWLSQKHSVGGEQGIIKKTTVPYPNLK